MFFSFFVFSPCIKEHLPWVEYIVDFGWVSELGIWCYVINREQDQAAMVYIPITSFVQLDETPMDSVADLSAKIQVMHKWNSKYWIPVSYTFYLLLVVTMCCYFSH